MPLIGSMVPEDVKLFMRQTCLGTAALRREVRTALADADTIMPPKASRTSDLMLTGSAIDYRIRFYFGIPPMKSLVAWSGAYFLSCGMLGADIGDCSWDAVFDELCPGQLALPGDLLQDLFDSLECELARGATSGSSLGKDHEQTLARYCCVLSMLEQCARALPSDRSPLFSRPIESLGDLLAVPDESVVEDVCALSHAFCDTHDDLFGRRTILNPVFSGSPDVGGADADLICGQTLVEIKTSINKEARAEWVRQVFGYVLLDYDDEYRIDEVGFYMARQARLVKWPLQEFLEIVTGQHEPHVATLREEFRTAICAGAKDRGEAS